MSHRLWDTIIEPAREEFDTSSIFRTPKGYRTWEIRNDYPTQGYEAQGGPVVGLPGQLPGEDPSPWLDVDPTKDPDTYLELVKEYFLEGMVEADFVAQDNHIRQWYHAPWMHAGKSAREPIRGLTAERFTPAGEFAKNQTKIAQNWAIGWFNTPAASLLGYVWADKAHPKTDKNLRFPPKSVIVKTIFTDSTVEEVPILRGSPTWHAVICSDPSDQSVPRNAEASQVRLLQMDVAVADDRFETGWVFGSFIYDGRKVPPHFPPELHGHQDERAAWERLLPIGLMWGNDPKLTQAAFLKGQKPEEGRLNEDAQDLFNGLEGTRPYWGWNGRMNGPADNFISACMSCHARAQVKLPDGQSPGLVQPAGPKPNKEKIWTPPDDSVTMAWFRNVCAGEPFTEGAVSTDFNLQVMIGLNNFQNWRKRQAKRHGFPWGRDDEDWEPPKQEAMLRNGPIIEYV